MLNILTRYSKQQISSQKALKLDCQIDYYAQEVQSALLRRTTNNQSTHSSSCDKLVRVIRLPKQISYCHLTPSISTHKHLRKLGLKCLSRSISIFLTENCKMVS